MTLTIPITIEGFTVKFEFSLFGYAVKGLFASHSGYD